MSVINQMLHDLESRRSQMPANHHFSHRDLSFIPKLSNTPKFESVVYSVLFGVVLAGIILFFTKINSGENNHAQNVITNVSNEQATIDVSNHANKWDASSESQHTDKQHDNNKQESSHYEVATSTIRKQDKVIVRQISIKKIVKTQPVTISKTSQTTQISQITTAQDGVVHKRRRELSVSQKVENLYQSAYDYLLAKNHVQAQEELRNALMLMPSHNKSRELLAGIYIKNSRIVEARTLLQYGMRISPTHTIFAKLYARILMDQNDNITAISVLLRNPPSQRADVDYHALLAALYQKNDQHHKAATLYSQLLKLRETNGVWWLGMAISLEALGNQSQAKLAYEKAGKSGNLSKGLYQYSHQRMTALEDIAYP